MNLSLKIARRYLLAKKSTNAINVISMIAILGITVGTWAIIIILSVFNGFEDLIQSLYGSFNPDIAVTIREGKVFEPNDEQLSDIKKLDGVLEISKTLEEVAFFEYGESQNFGLIKGVDAQFDSVSGVDEALIRGVFATQGEDQNYAVIGAGLENRLSIAIGDQSQSITVYMPKRKKRIGMMNDNFKRRFLYPVGSFAIQEEFDQKYVITSLDFVHELLSYRNGEIDAIEVKVAPTYNVQTIVEKIKVIMGDQFDVKDRYEQEEAFFKLMNMEKWLAFAVFSLALLLLAFNIIGALWMLVLEKKQDIAILKSMGATDSLVRNIFLIEGLLMCFIGAIVGFIFALIFYYLQKEFGIIGLGNGANLLIDSYPISLRLFDFVSVFITVMLIGGVAALLPSSRANKIPALVRGA